jgi:hypothetical protein
MIIYGFSLKSSLSSLACKLFKKEKSSSSNNFFARKEAKNLAEISSPSLRLLKEVIKENAKSDLI